MSRNYMRVIVVNESNATLRLRNDSTSGEWTPGGWQPSQFPETPPGDSLHWQAEGESVAGVALTGCRGACLVRGDRPGCGPRRRAVYLRQ
jgi:hypothetical protein